MAEDYEAGLEHVIGKPGSGKTLYVVHEITTKYMKFHNERYKNARQYIRNFNKLHKTNLTLPPQRHVVSSNIDIHQSHPNMSSYPINGFEFGVPNNYQVTKRLIPYGVYAFDEAQQYWDSKGPQNLPPWVNRVFELRRHIGLKIYAITQKLTRLHSDIRSTVDVFTIVNKTVHTFQINGKKVKTRKLFKKGRLLKTVIWGVHFTEESQVMRYLDGDHSVGESFIETHDGDIRKCYNHLEYAVALEDYDRDFNYIDYNEPDSSIEGSYCQLLKSWTEYKKKKKEVKDET